MSRFLVLILLVFCGAVQAAGERLLFYKLARGDAQVHLLGSMHLARADIYPLRPEIMQAFAGAGTLAVELDISGSNQLRIQQMILSRGTYPAGETIRDHLSPTTWQGLREHMSESGLPLSMLESMRPGLLVTTLSSMEMMKLGLSPELGVDRFFLERARGQKHIHEMETAEQQISLLLDFPQEDLLVRQTLAQLENMEAIMEELVSAWKSGDAEALQKLVIEDELRRNPEFQAIHERMFDHRNRDMSAQVEGFLQGSGNYFVVVGAGHLVGEQGIVALLKNKGYPAQQL